MHFQRVMVQMEMQKAEQCHISFLNFKKILKYLLTNFFLIRYNSAIHRDDSTKKIFTYVIHIYEESMNLSKMEFDRERYKSCEIKEQNKNL